MTLADFFERLLPRKEIAWVVRLRLGMVIGQLVTLTFVDGALAAASPMWPLAVLAAYTLVSNVTITVLANRYRSAHLTLTIVVSDVVVLATLLAAVGGGAHPFSIFLLVEVAVAALLLETAQVWLVALVSIVVFGILLYMPVKAAVGPLESERVRAELWMWLLYAGAAVSVAHTVRQIAYAIRARDRKLEAAAQLQYQNERLAMLSTFAGNAAHELGSPLATIALAAQELCTRLEQGAATAMLRDDATLIFEEAMRCRDILAMLSSRTGEQMGEMPVATTAATVVAIAQQQLPSQLRAALTISYAGNNGELDCVAPVQTLAQTINNLVRNAFEAQAQIGVTAAVELDIFVDELVHFCVRDRGPGIAPATLLQIGTPFISTKHETGGLGLGLYLARTLATQLGGHLEITVRPQGGTQVDLAIAHNLNFKAAL